MATTSSAMESDGKPEDGRKNAAVGTIELVSDQIFDHEPTEMIAQDENENQPPPKEDSRMANTAGHPLTLDISQTEAVLTSSLALIADYGISSDSESDSEESSSESSSSSEDEVQLVDTVSYRNTVNVISSEEDGESDVELVDSVEASAVDKRRPKKVIKAKGELGVEDLPPIEDLNISVPEHECLDLGTVMSIVDQLVLVESKPGSIALDLDTVLFLEQGQRTLGRIFDVLGQVNQPLYCIRFNSPEHIKEKKIVPGMKVYYNSQRPEHTSVVVLPNLMRFKGSDASWDHDIEPPEGCLEYSDDEQERSARKARKTGQKAIPEDPNQQRMKRVHPSTTTNNFRGRVRNPFAGGGPRQIAYGTHNGGSSWRNNNMNQQWPPSQSGYGNDYSNHSWHTYYQHQQPPPFSPQGTPFFMNPYAQPPPGWNSNGQYYPPGGPPTQSDRYKSEPQ